MYDHLEVEKRNGTSIGMNTKHLKRMFGIFQSQNFMR